MFARVRSARGTSLFVELLMIVVGINIALWFEGWFADLEDARTEQHYLAGLRDDIRTDLANLDGILEFNQAKLKQLDAIIPKLSGLEEASSDEQAATMFEPSGYGYFYPSDFTYRSMQESGDFRLLEDTDTKKSILFLVRLYRAIDIEQQNYTQALDDEYIPLMMRSFDMVEMHITDPAILDNQIFRNFFAYAHQDTQNRVRSYEAARKQAESLLEIVESQLD